MTTDKFLADFNSRTWRPDPRHRFQAGGLFIGKGTSAIEVIVAHASKSPTQQALNETWKSRRKNRAAPVLLVVLHPDGVAVHGAAGENPSTYNDLDIDMVEQLCREVLVQPDRHAALRFLSQTLPSLETTLPGINNEGLLALHELQRGVPKREDWEVAKLKAATARGQRGTQLLQSLGFSIEPIDNLTHLLLGGG